LIVYVELPCGFPSSEKTSFFIFLYVEAAL